MKLAHKITLLKFITWLLLATAVGVGGWSLYDVHENHELRK